MRPRWPHSGGLGSTDREVGCYEGRADILGWFRAVVGKLDGQRALGLKRPHRRAMTTSSRPKLSRASSSRRSRRLITKCNMHFGRSGGGLQVANQAENATAAAASGGENQGVFGNPPVSRSGTAHAGRNQAVLSRANEPINHREIYEHAYYQGQLEHREGQTETVVRAANRG